jgi:hypothetical protein
MPARKFPNSMGIQMGKSSNQTGIFQHAMFDCNPNELLSKVLAFGSKTL